MDIMRGIVFLFGVGMGLVIMWCIKAYEETGADAPVDKAKKCELCAMYDVCGGCGRECSCEECNELVADQEDNYG